MNAETTAAVKYTLVAHSELDVPVRVPFAAYLSFGRHLDRQLRRLVVQWSHVASPWSRGMPVAAAGDLATVAAGRGGRG
jgi:hypothetical protein